MSGEKSMKDKIVNYRKYQDVLARFLQLLQAEYSDELVSLVLYGSVARGEADKQSDVDLIIVLENPPDEYYKRSERVIGVLKELEKDKEFQSLKKNDYAVYFKPIIFSRKEAEESRYLFLDVVEDGIILYDRGNFFKDRLRSLGKRLKDLGAKRIFLKDGSWYWVLKPDLRPGEVFSL